MSDTISIEQFEWDAEKDRSNQVKHGLSFSDALRAFLDPHRLITFDDAHSAQEPRWFCIGLVSQRIATVRFTRRGHTIRIIGAGYWRKGQGLYEKSKATHGS